MLKPLLFSLSFVCYMQVLHAQISHDVTIYSEEGLKFTLVANGEQINAEPASRVKMENIEDDQLNVKVTFEDKNIPPLEKKYLQIAHPGTEPSGPVSAVYKIEQKNGEYKFKFYSRADKKIQPNETIIIQQQPPQDNPDIRISVPGMEIKVDDVKP